MRPATSDPVAPNPLFFIVGCPRSGTTLLQRLLDAHPDVAVVNESFWITRVRRRRAPHERRRMTQERLERIAAHPRFSRMEVSRKELDGFVGVPDEAVVHMIFDSFAERRRKRFAGDKTPAYVQKISRLHALLPQSRFVHLIRDGRDVALSALTWSKADTFFSRYPTYSRDAVTTAALWWERNVLLGREAGLELGDLYMEVRYEELVVDPVRVCRDVCEFLGIGYDAAMLRFHEGRSSEDPRLTTKQRWLPPTPDLRSWSDEMSRDDLERFEAAAGALVERLGYERGCETISLAVAEHAAAVRREFCAGVRHRRRPLPEEWTA